MRELSTQLYGGRVHPFLGISYEHYSDLHWHLVVGLTGDRHYAGLSLFANIYTSDPVSNAATSEAILRKFGPLMLEDINRLSPRVDKESIPDLTQFYEHASAVIRYLKVLELQVELVVAAFSPDAHSIHEAYIQSCVDLLDILEGMDPGSDSPTERLIQKEIGSLRGAIGKRRVSCVLS